MLLTDFYFTYWKNCNFFTLTSHYGKFNPENMYQTLSESASFVKYMTKTSWCVFSVHSSNCCSLSKHECKVSQGRVETLFRWGGKHLHFCTTNLLGAIRTKFYHSRSGFVDCISRKHFGVFFGSQCSAWYACYREHVRAGRLTAAVEAVDSALQIFSGDDQVLEYRHKLMTKIATQNWNWIHRHQSSLDMWFRLFVL